MKEQEYTKNKTRLTALMRTLGIKEIPKNEIYSNKYESFLSFECGDTDQKITATLRKKLDTDEAYVYQMNRYYGTNGQLTIKHVVKHATALSESEKKRRAESRKRGDHLRKVKAVYKDAYDLRCAWVKEFSSSSGGGGISSVTEKCLMAAMNQKNSWDSKLQINHNWNDGYIRMIFDLPRAEKDQDLFAMMDEKANLCRIMLAFALGGGIVSDSPDIGWYDRSDGRFDNKDHFYTADANRVYGLLEACGYQLSEMEQQLRDGTHECYKWEETQS